MRRRVARACGALALASSAWGCELQEITIVDVEPVVVAEVYANLAEGDDNEVLAFLHWTVGSDVAALPSLSGAVVVVGRADGLAIELVQNPIEDCVRTYQNSFLPSGQGACFLADAAAAALLRPGDLLELSIGLDGVGSIEGATVVPSTFDMLAPSSATCRLDPDALMAVRWSQSAGAWAYINETSIRGLPDLLRDEGIEVDEDPLYLLGLSISDEDTTIIFPSEFGVFNRFDLDQDVAVRLQSGLPEGAIAEVTITAVDRNYVNWARGGAFNPSGQVRVGSLRGDGAGVFASTLNRRFVTFVDADDPGTPACPLVPTP